MLNLKLKERRLNTRRKLTGLLPGKIIRESDGSDVSCRPVDISKDGLGILTETQLEEGDVLVLQASSDISLKVMWKKQDYGKASLFRYGVVTIDDKNNLEKIFMAAGCLK
jgi:hypothetical protein